MQTVEDEIVRAVVQSPRLERNTARRARLCAINTAISRLLCARSTDAGSSELSRKKHSTATSRSSGKKRREAPSPRLDFTSAARGGGRHGAIAPFVSMRPRSARLSSDLRPIGVHDPADGSARKMWVGSSMASLAGSALECWPRFSGAFYSGDRYRGRKWGMDRGSGAGRIEVGAGENRLNSAPPCSEFSTSEVVTTTGACEKYPNKRGLARGTRNPGGERPEQK